MLLEGFDEVTIIEALRCTSMRPELADLVLLEEKSGKGLPSDVPGIWSVEEDEWLEGGDARRLRDLEKKHSGDEMGSRGKFLERWREMNEEVEDA